ncbi:hypothetical protein ACWD25_03910 [Streptomyces sp. NPDC002920]
MDRRQGPRPRPRPEEGAGGKSEVDDRPAWLRLLGEIEEPCGQGIVDRVEELLWVLDHQEDIDADFLAIYGIDLEEHEITARRYFALAHRLTAYTGVMAARAEAEREEEQPAPAASSTPTRTGSTPVTERGNETELSVTKFTATFPWLVSVGQGG